ncbi:MAG TPA: CAP domain-containing protein [Candidatus Paceibacterota bacterium]
MKKGKKPQSFLKRYFAPHKKYDGRPAFFTRTSLATLVVGLLLVQGFYLIQKSTATHDGTILASVITELTNHTRAQQEAGPVVEDPLLSLAAQAKAEDMAQRGYFSHVDPDGIAPWAWYDAVDYTYRYAGENLAVNFTDSKDIEEAWIASPTHYANLIKPQYTRTGVGLAEGVYKGNKTTYVVQFFAAPPSGQRYSVYAHAQKALKMREIALTQPIRPLAANAPKVPQGSVQQAAGDVVASAPATPAVLGATAKQTWLQRTFNEISTSPRLLNRIILVSILLIVLIAFVIANLLHAQIKYREILFDVLILVVIIGALLWFNGRTKVPTEVPADTTGASIEVKVTR